MNIKRRLTAIGLILSLIVLIFGGRSPTAVYADAIEHTHIWATTYDSTNHWEYCTICGEKRNVTAHVFTDHWHLGHESCHSANWSNRTCTCGYNYIYRKTHAILSGPYLTANNEWGNYGIRGYHFWRCPDCGEWAKQETCKNSSGKVVNCANPGTCAVCGTVYTKDNHILKDGKCVNCGIQFVTYSSATCEYADDGTSVTVKFTVTPKDATVIQLKPAYYAAKGILTKQAWTVTKNGTKYVCTGILTFNQKVNVKTNISMLSSCTQINGVNCYSTGNKITIARDHTAPTVSTIKQTNQKENNGYATIKKLDISGTEDLSEYVKLSIIDKDTDKAVVNHVMINVTDNKWTYSCTPPLEAGASDRIYTVKIEDAVGNVSSKDFTICKTDSSAPQVESSLSYTDWTNTAKTITLTITDYGSGSPQASLGNQTNYKSCTKTSDGKYQVTYTFSDNIDGTKDYNLYLKDALGNAQEVVLAVGNIDKNKYTISYTLNNGSIKGQKTSYTVVDSFTLPTPTRNGYIFTGWTGSNGKTKQKTVTVSKGTRGNLTYTANWTPISYTVKYDANGGTGTMNTDTATYNENYVAKTNQFTRTGYEFAGWTENADGSGSNWTSWIGKPWKWTYTKNITLYAQWKANTYTITYEPNGGLGDKYTQTATYNEFFDTAKNKFTKTGYSFIGYRDLTSKGGTWAKTVIEGTKQTGSWVSSYVADKLRFYNYTDKKWITYDLRYWKGMFTEDNGCYANNFTLSAIWAANDYTILFDYGKSVDSTYPASTVAKYNSAYGELPQLVLQGWTFKGWNTKADGTGTTVTKNTVYKIAGDSTLYAQWSYNPVSVKVPQMLIGDHTGKSQFRVKCNDIKTGNIKITVPNSFLYKQAGKADVTAAITSKSGNNIITPTNKVCVYNITTKSGLSAGCWQGNFNIGLTLTKK